MTKYRKNKSEGERCIVNISCFYQLLVLLLYRNNQPDHTVCLSVVLRVSEFVVIEY